MRRDTTGFWVSVLNLCGGCDLFGVQPRGLKSLNPSKEGWYPDSSFRKTSKKVIFRSVEISSRTPARPWDALGQTPGTCGEEAAAFRVRSRRNKSPADIPSSICQHKRWQTHSATQTHSSRPTTPHPPPETGNLSKERQTHNQDIKTRSHTPTLVLGEAKPLQAREIWSCWVPYYNFHLLSWDRRELILSKQRTYRNITYIM